MKRYSSVLGVPLNRPTRPSSHFRTAKPIKRQSSCPFPLCSALRLDQSEGSILASGRGLCNRARSRFYHPPLCHENIWAPGLLWRLKLLPFLLRRFYSQPEAHFQLKACQAPPAASAGPSRVFSTSPSSLGRRRSRPRVSGLVLEPRDESLAPLSSPLLDADIHSAAADWRMPQRRTAPHRVTTTFAASCA